MSGSERPQDHPDEILHRARVGLPLSPRERLERFEHLHACAACRFLEEARGDLLKEAAAPAGGRSIAALVAATMASFEAPSSAATPARAHQPPPRAVHARGRAFGRAPALAAALVCAVAGAALAAHWIARPRSVGAPTSVPDSAPRARVAVVSPRAIPELPPVPAPSPEPQPLPLAAPPATEGPAALFARATAARRGGRADEARGAYEQLWRDFPDTPEAQTGLVAYGRWLLDRGEAQPAARAFADYLRIAPRETLAAEAGVGLAEALEMLGDGPRARRAWQDVLANPAADMHADHAKARLRALDARARRGATDSAETP